MNIRRNSDEVNAILKADFIDLLKEIKRPNANIEGLINKLESSDFFTAPASTKYHNAYIGGLVEHSLNVYYNLYSLAEMKGILPYLDPDSLLICGLLHDISKMNFYEIASRNEKVYHENGTKFDNIGKFDWQSVMSFKVKDVNDRFTFGNHEETSEFMVRTFIPLEVSESVAILNHHGGMGYDSVPVGTISDKYNKYVLASLLHMADFMAAFVDERESYE